MVVRSRVDVGGAGSASGRRESCRWLRGMCGCVGGLVMWAANCGARVSLLVMRYRTVASWMVLGDRRWEKK